MVEENKIDIFVNVVSLSFDKRTRKYVLEVKTHIDMTNNPIFKNFWLDRQEVNSEWGSEYRTPSNSHVYRYKIHELHGESIDALTSNYNEYIEYLKQEVENKFIGFKKNKFQFEDVHLIFKDGFFEEERLDIEVEVQFETK